MEGLKELALAWAENPLAHFEGLLAIRLWENGAWAWVGPCEHIRARGYLKPCPPLCGREDCRFGRAERFWAGLGLPPGVKTDVGRYYFPGVVWIRLGRGLKLPGDLKQVEDRVRYAFMLWASALPTHSVGPPPGGVWGEGLGARLVLVPVGPHVDVVPRGGDFAAWVYKLLLDRIRQDLGSPRSCRICGRPIGGRADRKTCSERCRKALGRRNRRLGEILGKS